MKNQLSSLQTTLCIVAFLSHAMWAQGCDVGWFGSSCQYKCHCTGNNCDNNGDCTGDNGCVPGWFGPQCQYVDLSVSFTENDGRTNQVFRDGNDTTCIDNPTQTTAPMFFNRAFPFTWLRLHVKHEGLLENINVWFADVDDNQIWCQNRTSAAIDSRTIDIHCNVSVEVKYVQVISTDAVPVLCSIYISGGRNVALKQDARQTSTYSNYEARLAVDGNTTQVRGSFGTEGCSKTRTNIDPNPSWSVTFTNVRDINRYVIYNKVDCCPESLKEFVLTTFDQDDKIKFTYRDPGTSVYSVYTVTSVTNTSPVRRVSIEVAVVAVITAQPPLTLCEVEIYGDTVCPVGKYGRECEHTCNCADTTEKCFVSTGGCPGGCAAGYTGENCNQTCPATFYGEGCGQKCSTNCQSQLCDRRDGKCQSCVWGKKGTYCQDDCIPKTYGPGCIYSCNTICSDQLCNATDGRCLDCPAGTMGDQCTQDCPKTTFGPRCVNPCSTTCLNQVCKSDTGVCVDCPPGTKGDYCGVCESGRYGPDCKECSQFCNTSVTEENESPCHHVTGVCVYGCVQGYEGLFCEPKKQSSASPSSSSSDLGVGLGIGLGVAALIVLVGVAIYCYRRRSHAQTARRQVPPGYDTADPTTDEHKYSDLFKSADNYSLPTDMQSSSVIPTSPPENNQQDRVQYENADIGHYEEIGKVSLNEESTGQYMKQPSRATAAGKDNAGYANV